MEISRGSTRVLFVGSDESTASNGITTLEEADEAFSVRETHPA